MYRSRWTLLSVLLLLTLPLGAQETTDNGPVSDYGQIKKSLHKHKKDLAAIQKKLKEEKRKKHIDEVREKRVLGQLERVDQALGKLRRSKETNESDLQDTQRRLAVLHGQMGANQQELAQSKALLKQRLRDLQRMSFRKPFLGGVLDAENFGELARKLKFEMVLARSNEKILSQTLAHRSQLQRSNVLWSDEERRRKKIIGVLGRQEVGYSREKRNRRAFLETIQQKKESHERYIEELNLSAQDLQTKVSVFLEQAETARKSQAAWVPVGKGLSGNRGRLPWPVKGPLLQHFGRHKNVQFKEIVDNSGIQIQATQGTPIQAIAGGKVRFADWFKGYGKLVILDHGEGYYSLYAQAAELDVAEGQTVIPGQVIGTVGDTGSLVGNSLYFEIRKNGLPQDPVPWLKPR